MHVEADPGERLEMSEAHADVVAKLRAIVVAHDIRNMKVKSIKRRRACFFMEAKKTRKVGSWVLGRALSTRESGAPVGRSGGRVEILRRISASSEHFSARTSMCSFFCGKNQVVRTKVMVSNAASRSGQIPLGVDVDDDDDILPAIAAAPISGRKSA